MKKIHFLILNDVVAIHEDQIARYGGLQGERDIGLLESAIAQPFAQFEGQFLHKTIFQMAASYAYHICLNHPFSDANKRTALVAMILFLKINGIHLNCAENKIEELMLKIPEKKITKLGITRFLQKSTLLERNPKNKA